jgi:prepilin-type processing-associated H-X9-DG protein
MRQIVQTLVVLLIVATGAGLVVSAVAKVRDAARRMQCLNNLRQIGLGVGNYQDTYQGRYPSAAMAGPQAPAQTGPDSIPWTLDGQMPPEQRLSWLVDLIPYIEQTNLDSRLDKTQGWDTEENRFAALLSWQAFHCPGYPEGPPASTLWPSHYVGIGGVGEDAAWLPAGDPRAGFFGYERTLTSKDLVRGNSATAVAAETSVAQGAWTAAGSTVRGFDPASAHFGGNHRGGCQVVFADGSVRWLDAKTSEGEWMRLVVLADPGQEADAR